MKKYLTVLLVLLLSLGLFVSCEEEKGPKVYTIHFDMNGHGEDVADITVTNGRPSSIPSEPICDDYSFEGWYTEAECVNPLSLGNLPSGTTDITLYAKWARLISSEAALRTAFTEGGLAKLDGDITLSSYMTTVSRVSLAAEKTLELDLNGHVLDANENYRFVSVYGSLTILDSNPTREHLDYQESDEDFPKGGVIYNATVDNYGAGIAIFEDGSFLYEGGTIYKCIANYGGGISTTDNAGSLTITGGAIIGCEATTGVGGGIYSLIDCEASNFTISGCTAATDAGGLYSNGSSLVLDNVTVSDCTATVFGGGIYNDTSEAQLSNVTISGCTSSTKYGGGLYASENTTSLTMENSTISGCSAPSTSGGGIYSKATSLVLDNVSISGCSAYYQGGGIMSCSASNQFNDLTIDGCESTAQSGGAITFWTGCSEVSISNSTFTNCSANSNGAGLFIYGDDVVGTMDNVEISNCSAYQMGGGINITGKNVAVTMNDVEISNCEARESGGIYITSTSSVTMSNGSSIIGCKAIVKENGKIPYGGAASVYGTLKLDGTQNAISITGNSCENYDDNAPRSAAIQVDGTLEVCGKVTVTGNERLKNGVTSYSPDKVYSNVRLYGSARIKLVGEGLTSDSSIGVRTAALPTAGKPCEITKGTLLPDPLTIIYSDDSAYETYRDGDILKLKVK